MTSNNHEWKMSELALLILLLSLLISKNAIEGDRNVNHRSLQSGNIQDLQPVNHFGNYPSRDEPINYSGSRYQPRDYRRPLKTEKKMRQLKNKKKRQQFKKKKQRRQYVTGKQTFRLCQSHFFL